MSNQNNFIKSTFEKGMWLDSHYSYQPPGTYKYALNMIHETDQYRSSEGEGTFIAQEQSTKKILDLPATPVGYGYVESRDWAVFLLSNNEIGYVDLKTHKYKSIYKGSCFNFSSCEYIEPEFSFRYGCNELLMYFSSNCTYYKINIDEQLRNIPYCGKCPDDSDDGECCSHFKVMKGVNIPNITVERYEGGGAGAESGSYSFVVQCEDEDGNTSNWFTPSKPKALVGPNGKPGEPSKNVLKVHIKELDRRYTKANVAVIKNIGGVRSWSLLGSYPYNTQGVTIHFSGTTTNSTDLDPREIFVPKKKYIRGRKLKIYNSKLHLYQVRQERQLNTFKYSSKINTEWVAYAVDQEQSKDFMSLERLERYRVGIVYNYADGTHSAVGQIPAGGGGSMSADEISAWNQKNNYSFWQDEKAQRLFQNVNPQPPKNTSRASSQESTEDPNQETNTSGSAPSPGDTVAGYSASFSENKKPLVNKDINNNFLDKDAYNKGVEIEKESLDKRLSSFEAHAPESYSKSCGCEECDTDSCIDALELWENQDQNIYDYETNTAWNTINKIDPDPTQHPDIESNRQVTGNVKEAEKNIYKNAKNAEDKEYQARKLNISGKTSQAGLASTGANNESRDRSSQKEIGSPVEIARGSTKIWTSSIDYPATKDCNGQPVYGGLECTPIRDHQMPSGSEIPIWVSAADGTISRYTMDAKEKGDSHAILLGLSFSGIELPPEDELLKPLNATNPYSIVFMERDAANTSVIAKGLATGVFEGNIQGKAYIFGKHGVNSSEFIDRCVSDGPEQSRLGSGSSDSGFLFHSPTTDILKPVLDVSKVTVENNVSGSGNRLGLYAETSSHGKFSEPLIDNRGYRGSINMNHLSGGGGESNVSGITYVRADSVVTPVGGLSTPLCNRFRERSVFVAASINTPTDASFQGDTVDHHCPITNCKAQYVALTRELPNQYGSVEGATYIPLGLEGVNGSDGSVSGTCGDVFISFYTKRRTSYISDKNGNDLTVDKDLWNSLRLNMGMADFWKLPEDGNAEGTDVKDPKARAGTQGPKRCSPGDASSSQYDVYLPSVAKHLIMFPVESRVHSDWREVGDPDLGEVWYDNLKTLEFDSDTPKQQDWINSWMNRFYAEHIRPSQKQLLTRVLIRFAVISFMTAFIAFGNSNLNSTVDIITLIAKAGAVTAFLPLIQRLLFNNRMLNRMLGIREWYVDDSEGNLDSEYIKQFEDVYCHYNLDYSIVNAGKVFFGINEFFYDCDCDDCNLGETTNEIYISNRQLQGASIDSFVKFQANSYLNIDSTHGKLQKLFETNNRLYAHTSDTILALMPNPNALTNPELGNVYYADPISFSEGIPEGNYGTIDPNFNTVTKWGYVFLDREHRTLNVFSQGGVEEISAKGTKNFWKEFTDFCDSGCVDQKNNIFYSLGVDHRHNRLLITKKGGSEDKSFTLSYDLERKVWRSFHDYKPNIYVWNRRNMYNVDGTSLYLHDNNRGSYLNLNGVQRAAEIEFNAVLPSVYEYDSTILDTEANIAAGDYAWTYNQKVTFNKAIVYNRNQCTGWMDLIVTDDPDQNIYNFNDPSKAILKWQDKEWRFNQVSDYLIDGSKPIFIDNGSCNPFLKLNESNIDQSKQAHDGNWTHQRLSDKNFTYRLVFDDENSKKYLLYFKQALTHYNLPSQ